jgi:ubiquitin-like protein 4
VDSQRLLLKGKVLADSKLLKEYDIKDGDTINLMVRAGSLWDPSAITAEPTPVTPEITTTADPEQITLVPEQTKQTRQGHTRIPSVVLSPSPSLAPIADEKLVDIPLVLDTSNIPPSSLSSGPDTPYHTKISQPEFWQRLYTFLRYVPSGLY